jgi:hypothetical protein
MSEHKGSKYEAGRDIAVIAKLVRADIKAAIKERKLPADLKTRVKIDRFAGGCSLDVIVMDGGEGCFNPLYWQDLKARPHGSERPSRYTDMGKSVLATLEAICKDYQYSDVDSMSDYFNTNFYLDVKFDFAVEHASGAAIA